MKIEIRSTGEALVSGYVNCVERDSSLLPPSMCPKAKKKFIERVHEGAFRRAIGQGGSIELRFNHEKIIGSTEGKTLTLYEDGVGLFARAVISDPEVIEKAKNGELRGWSFGFSDAADRWEAIDAETDRRYLDSFNLKEVSLLDMTPAYVGTSITDVETRGKAPELEYRAENAPDELLRLYFARKRLNAGLHKR